MKVSYHSVHQPKCGVCKKHCKSFESVREHLTGPLPKDICAKTYIVQGCDLCVSVFDSTEIRDNHKESCRLSSTCQGLATMSSMRNGFLSEMEISDPLASDSGQGLKVVALDCEMFGGGSDGRLDLCARVCIIDKDEIVIFHTFVMPTMPVSNYRFEITGITEDDLLHAMPLMEVRERILEILFNGETLLNIQLDGGKARILVGHDLEYDLSCLCINYPDHLMRDTAKYRPLMKTNLISHSLKYLTKAFLGYEIQSGVHDPYEDCVAAMRLYKRMRGQVHPLEETVSLSGFSHYNDLEDPWKQKELLKMSPDALFEISRSNYRCWCLDSRPEIPS